MTQADAHGAAAHPKRLVTYQLFTSKRDRVKLFIHRRGGGRIVDAFNVPRHHKPVTYHFTLSPKQLSRLRQDIDDARVNQLPSRYPPPQGVITCGRPPQILNTHGRRIFVPYGAAPRALPQGLKHLLNKLYRDVTHRYDPGTGAPAARGANRPDVALRPMWGTCRTGGTNI